MLFSVGGAGAFAVAGGTGGAFFVAVAALGGGLFLLLLPGGVVVLLLLLGDVLFLLLGPHRHFTHLLVCRASAAEHNNQKAKNKKTPVPSIMFRKIPKGFWQDSMSAA